MKFKDEILMRENESMDKLEALEKEEDNIGDTLDVMMANVNSIMMKLDMDPIGPDSMNDSKSKKSKKAKQAKPEVPEPEGDLFTRNLLGVKEVANERFIMMERQAKSIESRVESIDVKVGSVESKGNSIEGKVKLIESKVDSMEGKIGFIEGKVESIEKTMEELKDMLSQLMTRGSDIA